MNSKIRRTVSLLAVAGLVWAVPARAEESFTCGTSDDQPGMGLQKSSAAQPLPTIKVYKGTLKAYVFRIQFSDVPSNVTEATIVANNVIINDFYKAMSRSLFFWEFAVHPTPLTMPGTAASYDSNFSALRSDITAAVNATGLKRGTDYAVYNVTFPKLNSLGWSGLSSGGTSGQNYMNGSYGTGVTSHEMGHTVGLAHAHAIEAGADMFGVPGTTSQHVEYGHPFDVMGRGGSTGHFNICYKYRDGWTDGAGIEVVEVKNTGLYRIYAQDNPDHAGRLLGIRVPAGNPVYGYWFEYHSNSTTNRKGASVMFDGWNGTASRADTWFMDLTPATTTENDGVMIPGMEFKDNYGEGTFKVTGINAVAGAEGWVEVAVTIPGTLPIRPLSVYRMRSALGGDSPVFSLAGRQLQNRVATQVLTLRRDGAPSRLILQER